MTEQHTVSVFGISYAKNAFKANNFERRRLEACAALTGGLHLLVFTRKKEGFSKTVCDNGLVLYPTNSWLRVAMPFSALYQGWSILRTHTEINVVTAQDPFESGMLCLLLARLCRLPCNVQEHGDVFARSEWRREKMLNYLRFFVGIRVLRNADTVRIVGARSADTLIQLGVSPKRLLQLPVQTKTGLPAIEPAADLRVRFPNASVIVLAMGRLVPQKNLSLLLRSFKEVYVPGTVLVLVGSGEERLKLTRLAESLAITDRVHFLPWTEYPASCMQTCDVFALSSNYEGWGLVLLEAMTAGKPIVTTDVGCVGEVVLDQRHALVVPVGDKEAYTAALRKLLEGTALRLRLGSNGARDNGQWTITDEAYAEKWVAILATTIATYNR
jgi:glycosyltransferase involved in cell wall biosynthesis